MYRTLSALAAACIAAATLPVAAQTPTEVTLTRLDCGTVNPAVAVNQRFSDTYDLGGLKLDFVFSCYLVKHGDEYLLWDTGHSMSATQAAKTSLPDQLAQLHLKPEQINYVGISHYHGDHTGQAGSFPKSTLLIGKGDWDAISAAKPAPGVNAAAFGSWISGGGKVEPIATDLDVFKDGTVVMLYTPGHTPGHHSLLVKLPQTGAVLLSGDLAHFRENYEANGVPTFNADRSQTLASLERFKKIAANLKATVVIQHDARDVTKLPAFPAAAK